MKTYMEAMKAMQAHPFNFGDPDCKTVLDQIYRAYAESHENDPPDIQEGFAELETYLEALPLNDNNAVFNLCCRLCVAYEYWAAFQKYHHALYITGVSKPKPRSADGAELPVSEHPFHERRGVSTGRLTHRLGAKSCGGSPGLADKENGIGLL